MFVFSITGIWATEGGYGIGVQIIIDLIYSFFILIAQVLNCQLIIHYKSKIIIMLESILRR